MHIETVAVERLIPYTRNSRTHSEAQVAQWNKQWAAYYWAAGVAVAPGSPNNPREKPHD